MSCSISALYDSRPESITNPFFPTIQDLIRGYESARQPTPGIDCCTPEYLEARRKYLHACRLVEQMKDE